MTPDREVTVTLRVRVKSEPSAVHAREYVREIIPFASTPWAQVEVERVSGGDLPGDPQVAGGEDEIEMLRRQIG